MFFFDKTPLGFSFAESNRRAECYYSEYNSSCCLGMLNVTAFYYYYYIGTARCHLFTGVSQLCCCRLQ